MVTFFDLPLEIILMIKTYLDPWDLRTVVCLYLADPRCAVLHDWETDPEAFWKTICWKNGLGRLPLDGGSEDGVWQDIALQCIERDGFCKHPHCGDAMLEYNRERMRESADCIEAFSAVHVTEDYDADVSFAPNPVLFYIDFRKSDECRDGKGQPIEDDAYLRWDNSSGSEKPNAGDARNRAYLGDHPITARSFATATPVSNILLLNMIGWRRPKNETLKLQRPVTVYDLLGLLHEDLDYDLTVRDVFNHVGGHLECFRRMGWGVDDTFENLKTTREVLSVCPINSVEIVERTESGLKVRFCLQ
ncbi:hypothetical protein BD311DRAFT_773905 [Dichomitus squalens]|uniref:Uncharacterized protein n=1 Tax=Dichomitus squalens TaxID=114155 RepID=A0A4Q9N0Q2_9APHY|nr:hypothetical protein BD311DRAFT_773905 [Dichomitus squalens]